MAHWAADAKEVPPDVRDALAAAGPLPPGPADAYVHVRSGLDSLLGDTHLVLAGGRLRIASRGTSLSPLAEASLVGRPHLDDAGYRPVLVVPTAEGVKRLEVTALEEDAVEDLLRDLPATSTPRGRARDVAGAPAAPTSTPSWTQGAAGEPWGDAAPASDGDPLTAAREALVSTLARRQRQRRAELLAQRYTRKIAQVDVKLGTRRDEHARWRARHRPERRSPERSPSGIEAAPRGRSAAAPADTAPAAAREVEGRATPPEPPRPAIVQVVRAALLVLLGYCVFRMFGALGQMIAERR